MNCKTINQALYICSMQKQVLIIFFIYLFFSTVSCTSEKAETINGPVFSEDSMKILLIDFYITESSIRQHEREGKDIYPYISHYYNLMLEKYNCDTNKISRSFLYWTSQPEKFKIITNKALDSLIVLETLLPD